MNTVKTACMHHGKQAFYKMHFRTRQEQLGVGTLRMEKTQRNPQKRPKKKCVITDHEILTWIYLYKAQAQNVCGSGCKGNCLCFTNNKV